MVSGRYWYLNPWGFSMRCKQQARGTPVCTHAQPRFNLHRYLRESMVPLRFAHIQLHMQTYICIHVCIRICIHTDTRVYTYIYIYTRKHILCVCDIYMQNTDNHRAQNVSKQDPGAAVFADHAKPSQVGKEVCLTAS